MFKVIKYNICKLKCEWIAYKALHEYLHFASSRPNYNLCSMLLRTIRNELENHIYVYALRLNKWCVPGPIRSVFFDPTIRTPHLTSKTEEVRSLNNLLHHEHKIKKMQC